MADITDKFGKSSIDTNYAIATTVKTTRTAGVAVLEAFDLSRYATDTPVYFITYKKTTDPVTGIVSVTSLVSWKGLVNVGANTLTNLTLAPGYADTGNAVGDFIECIPTSYWENSLIDGIFVGHNPDGTFKKAAIQSALGNDGNLVSSLDDIIADFVVSGGIWAVVSGLNGSMTLLTAYIDGYKNTVAAVATRAFTPSKDTYVDVLRNTGTNVFTLVYTEAVLGAASPALAANSVRLAKVVTSGAAITSIVQTGSDSLGNMIRNTGAVTPDKLNLLPTIGAGTAGISTTSTSYVTLTGGATTTVVVGAKGILLVSLFAQLASGTDANKPTLSFAMSGANTSSGTDTYSVAGQRATGNNSEIGQFSGVFLLTGLTAGSTVLTCVYRNSTPGTGTSIFRQSSILAIPL
ncbi:hypothetical protein BH23PAT2_BH23PAT2_08240 [soil metagenome]